MKKLKFTFPPLPSITNAIKWRKGVEADIRSEIPGKISTMWIGDDNEILEVTLRMEEEENLICALHNLHSAKIITS